MSSSEKQNVVVIGGGYGGAIVTHALSAKLDSSKYNLILIDKRGPVHVYLITTARLAVSSADGLDKNALLPYDRIFVKGNGEYIHGKVTAIEKTGTSGGHVVLEHSTPVPFHVLILACGSKWEGPMHFPDKPENISRFIEENQTKVKNAESILIAGGGAVGVELCGEILDVYPTKSVTIVHGGEHLLNGAYPIKYRKYVEQNVTSRGAKVVLNDFIDDVPSPGAGTVKTRSGTVLDADLVLTTRGPKPNTDFIASSLGSDAVDEKGYVKVKPTFQLSAYADIFALGDIVNIVEQKQAVKAMFHSGVLIPNVVNYLAGKPITKKYTGSMESIFITGGKYGGTGFIPILWGIMIGNWLVSLVKSRGLFLSMYKGNMGYG